MRRRSWRPVLRHSTSPADRLIPTTLVSVGLGDPNAVGTQRPDPGPRQTLSRWVEQHVFIAEGGIANPPAFAPAPRWRMGRSEIDLEDPAEERDVDHVWTSSPDGLRRESSSPSLPYPGTGTACVSRHEVAEGLGSGERPRSAASSMRALTFPMSLFLHRGPTGSRLAGSGTRPACESVDALIGHTEDLTNVDGEKHGLVVRILRSWSCHG